MSRFPFAAGRGASGTPTNNPKGLHVSERVSLIPDKARTLAPAAGYAVSFAGLAAVVLLRGLLDPLLGDTLPLVTLYGAVVLAVWVSGYRAAIAIATLGYVVCSYLFIEPRGVLGPLNELATVVGLLAYAFTCTLIIVLGEAMCRAQVRAAEDRELLRVTLRSIGDAVITTDVEGRITYLNEVAESMTGWLCADAVDRPLDTVFRIVNETTHEVVDNPAARALREGVVVGLANHTLLIRKDGTETPIDDSAAPIRDERGKVSGCVLIFRDVTAQRRAERDNVQQLLAARLLASIVESSEVAIISKSLQGTIETWNAAAERLFGYSAAHAVGRHISLVIPPERIAEEEEIIASVKSARRIEHFETERLRADGTRVWVSLTVSPVKDDAGNVIGASKMVSDITERKRLEDDLRRLAADLSEADARKNEFLATLAHELRGPLAPLSNVLAVWKRADDPAMLDRARGTMERQLGQMVRLVDDLLDLNRITHNRLELRTRRVQLEDVILQAIEASRPLADSLGHELRVTIPPEPCWLNADAARLAQVFGNLLNNACKYSDPGGEISVTAERRGDQVAVTVRDTGTGIPAENLDTIFDMFMQVDPSLAKAQGGLGIGLTLVKRLVLMHGGAVEATSAGRGRGSEFIVTLPVLAAEPAAGRPGAAQDSAAAVEPPHGHRILIVDDNVDSAESLAMLLQIEGNETFTAHDGLEAIAAAEKQRPDLMLLDIGLPTLNGYDVCRRVRAADWGKTVVLIALTGWGQDEDRRKSREAGFDGHLVKPVDHAALAELLRSLTAARAGR